MWDEYNLYEIDLNEIRWKLFSEEEDGEEPESAIIFPFGTQDELPDIIDHEPDPIMNGKNDENNPDFQSVLDLNNVQNNSNDQKENISHLEKESQSPSTGNSQIGNVRHCKYNPFCRFQNKEKTVEYVQNVVLIGQRDKFTREDKIIVFNFFQDYIKKNYPDLDHNEKLKNLNRDEKRNVNRLDERLHGIGSYIYDIFQTSQKNEIVLKILQQIDKATINKLEQEIIMLGRSKQQMKKQILLENFKKELSEIEERINEILK